jgi:nucleotide-binding universal stress UspA family protein
MKTLLVPMDFSDTAKNAARYAVKFAENIPGCRVLLFHTYDKHAYGSDGSPLNVDEEAESSIAMAALNNTRIDLLMEGSRVPVEMMAYGGGFTEGLEQMVDAQEVGMVVMGINESNALDQFLVGSTTLKLIKKHISPVLIVPENVSYKNIDKIAFASDLEQTDTTTPVSLISFLCTTFNTNIHVVHVGGYYNPDERALQAEKLAGCNAEFHFLEGNELSKPLNAFTAENGVGLLLMVSRQHDFFERLFKKSHTQVMAYHSTVPILAIHETLCGVPVS